jgi:transcriptional regulator with XRE-family HTH domain
MARSRSAAELRKRTIPALMGAHGENQTALGNALGLTQGQISRKLSGQAALTLEDVDAVAEHYGITPAQLLSGRTVAVSRSLQAKEKVSDRADDSATDQ